MTLYKLTWVKSDSHEVHEVSITCEVLEGETLLGRADLDAVNKGVPNITKKRGRAPYIKYTGQDRAQIEKYCSMHGATATVRKFVSTFPILNKSTTRTMRQMHGNEL